jgi:hypothetical protein
MPDLKGQEGELRFKVQVTRAATGLIEEYELIGKITHEEAQQLGLTEEPNDGRNPLDHGA